MLSEIFSRTLSYFSSLSREGRLRSPGLWQAWRGGGTGAGGAAGPGWPGPPPPPDGTRTAAQLCFLFPSNKSDTLPLATRYNIKCVGLSPDGRLAIIVDEGNHPRPTGGDGMGWWLRAGCPADPRPTLRPLGVQARMVPSAASVSGAPVGLGWACGVSSLAVCRRHRGAGPQDLMPACDVRGLPLLSLPTGGDALLTSLVCRAVLHRFHFKGAVHSVSFSPDGRYTPAGGAGAVELQAPSRLAGSDITAAATDSPRARAPLGPPLDLGCTGPSSPPPGLVLTPRVAGSVGSRPEPSPGKLCPQTPGHGGALVLSGTDLRP